MAGTGHWRCVGLLAALALLIAPLLSACVATVEPHAPVRLEMAGSTSMQSLVEELADAYTSRHEYVTIGVDPNNSALGLQALRDGKVDVALVSRELTPDEEQGLQATVIAYDAIAIVVNDGNGISSLSVEQVKDIFSGEVLVWSELGGNEVDIQVLSREDGSGTRDAFEQMVMEGRRVTLGAMVAPGSEAMGQLVAEDALAIGYMSAADVPLGARALSIDGVNPDLLALTQRDYPIIRPFTLVTRQNPDEEVRQFIDFVLGPAGQVIVGRRYGRAR